MTPQEYRSELPRAYYALLAHHGRPTEVQLQAIEPIMAGHDTIICAPTASGKTVAYVAPLVEKYCQPSDTKARVIIISPTRALVNDLHRRLAVRLDQMGISVGRWTGDHHDGGRPQPVTILTPEGLDSRLSRAPEQLSEVCAVVLDELHVLDGTPRGDQLRILVERMRVERDKPGEPAPPLQVVAASATVPDPVALASRYQQSAVVVNAGASRPCQAKIVLGHDPALLLSQVEACMNSGVRKVLAFCNSKKQVEEFAYALKGQRPFRSAVFAHHGRLAKGVRLQVEAQFLREPVGICFATCTLELGIDIGDVDLVVLIGAPPDIPAMLQRIGRGNRRSAKTFTLAFASDAFEAHVLRTMLTAAGQGQWLTGPSHFRPSVLVQQAISILQSRASRTIDAGALHRRLPPDLAAEWSLERLDTILRAMIEAEWLEVAGRGPGGQRYRLGVRGDELWQRCQAHANIQSKPAIPVIDAVTGETVGEVSRRGRTLALGGKGRKPIHQDAAGIVTIATREAEPPRFQSGPAPMVHPEMARAVLQAAGIPRRCRFELCHVPVREVLFHALGSAGGALLAATLKHSGALGTRSTGLYRNGRLALVLKGTLSGARWPSRHAVRTALEACHTELADEMDLGPYHSLLPIDEQMNAVAQVCDIQAVEDWVELGLPPLLPSEAADMSGSLGLGDIAVWSGAAWW